jgi:hypothetical protein
MSFRYKVIEVNGRNAEKYLEVGKRTSEDIGFLPLGRG